MDMTGAGSGWLADEIRTISVLGFLALCATHVWYTAWKSFGDADESDCWPVAPGRIVASALIEDGDGHPQPAIEYTWTVNGCTYRGNRLPIASFVWQAKEFCSLPTVGAPVDVAYDPTDPSKAILASERRREPRAVLWVVLVVPFVFAWGLLAIVMLRD